MFLLALLPLLPWYKIPFPVGLGYALLLPFSVYAIFINKFKINVVPASFGVVFIYVSSIWIYNHNFELWTLFPPGGWVFFIFTLALIWGVITFNLRLLKKYMRWVVIISGILFWIQFLLLTTTGSQHFCFVPNLTGEFTYEDFYIFRSCTSPSCKPLPMFHFFGKVISCILFSYILGINMVR